MPDYLHALLGRTVDAEPVIQPRVPSLFEPVRPAVGDVSSFTPAHRSANTAAAASAQDPAAADHGSSRGIHPMAATPRPRAGWTTSHPLERRDGSPAETRTDGERREMVTASDAERIDRSAAHRRVEAPIVGTSLDPSVPQPPSLAEDGRAGGNWYTAPTDRRALWPDPATSADERPHEVGLPLSAGDLRLRLATLERAIAAVGRNDARAPEVSVLVHAAEPPRERPVGPIARSGASAPLPAASPALVAGVRSSPPERSWQPSPPRRLVQVSIGRLEIRVDREPPAARRVPAEAVTATSLSEYLDRRNGAGR